MSQTMPLPDRLYRALVERDRGFEGLFVVGVVTTGVFCRPTCPARKPRRENARFFPSGQEALAAGFRPCRRCRPLEASKASGEVVDRLMRAVDAEPERRWTAQDLRSAGISPATARRHFQRHFGLSFAAWSRARRLQRALAAMQDGAGVIDAQFEGGFESPSGFRSAFLRLFGAPPAQAAGARVLHASRIDTPLGAMVAVADEEVLRLLEFEDRRALPREIAALRRRAGAAVVPGESGVLAAIHADLDAYFAGRSLCFTTPFRRDGTPFQESVWRVLDAIPPGTTTSYREVARRVGHPHAVRAVARANGANCLALVVPCHRVVSASGDVSGYGGGRWRKQWLIDHERRHAEEAAAPTTGR